MDVQFYGANCLVFSVKDLRVVVDDNLESLGLKSVGRPNDVLLYTTKQREAVSESARMLIDMPGEYEIGNLSIVGIPARAHMDTAEDLSSTTMYKLTFGDTNYLVTGHIFPDLTDDELEMIGLIDVMFVPVGGGGYTLDPVGALKLVKAIEPKLVIPTHYDDKALEFEVPQLSLDDALKELAMEPKERATKLKLKPGELPDVTQLFVLEKA